MKSMQSQEAKLSSRHNISDYFRMEKQQNRQGIVALIRLRLTERYVDPVEYSTAKHGFASMALACLLIETIQSFREGLGDTKGRSKEMFLIFLKHEPGFAIFANIADSFFKDVRCGLLHQGETRNGWTVMRRGPLFDPTENQVNATLFLRAVHNALVAYCGELERAAWEGEQWEKCRAKMAAIIANCEAK